MTVQKCLALLLPLFLLSCASATEETATEEAMEESYTYEGSGYDKGYAAPSPSYRDYAPRSARRLESAESPAFGGDERASRQAPTRGFTPATRGPDPDDIISQLSQAYFGYSVPKKVNIADTFDVQVLVHPKGEGTSPEAVLRELNEGQLATGTLVISRVLVATLTSDDFQITPITPSRQAVARRETTEWLWELKPLKAGVDRKIRINIAAVVEVEGERAERFIETYDGFIQVEVTPRQRVSSWLSNNWQWAWSALLIPLLGWLTLRWRRRSKRDV